MSPSTPDRQLTPLILAGGLGTRLRSVTGPTPKVLAAVRNKPFITYLLKQLVEAGFGHACISVGYGAEMIRDTLGESCCGLTLDYCSEEQPLGTGGAARLALDQIDGPMLVMNGDSMVDASLVPFVQAALETPNEPMLLAVQVSDVNRYGSLDIRDGVVARFREKGGSGPGWINAGIYYFPREAIAPLIPGQPASLEIDVLEGLSGSLRAFRCECGFIDIGTPESYALGQSLKWLE